MSATPIDILSVEASSLAVRDLPFGALAAYAAQGHSATEALLDTARSVLLGALADVFFALNQIDRMRAVRALLPGNIRPGGARVPGTSYELEPCAAATAISMLMHGRADRPVQSALRSCPLAAALSAADFVDRKRAWRGMAPLTMRELLLALLRAEQLRRALEQSAALAMSEQHCLLGATTAVTLSLLQGNAVQIGAALHRVWQSASTPLSLADLHAEAVRRALSADEPSPATVTSSVVIAEVLELQLIPRCANDEHGAAVQRFEAAVQTRLPLKQCERIKAIVAAPGVLDGMAINAFMAELVAYQA
jgi:hypothetical protein